MEFVIVRTENNVAQFVKHRINHLLQREELIHIARITKAQENLFATVNI
jgi:hypothetical protein